MGIKKRMRLDHLANKVANQLKQVSIESIRTWHLQLWPSITLNSAVPREYLEERVLNGVLKIEAELLGVDTQLAQYSIARLPDGSIEVLRKCE